MSDLNDEIRAAIDTSDVDRARALLREALNNTPDADIYYLASLVALSDDQKQRFLKKATELDPFHSEAHAALGATAQNIPAQPVAPAQQETAPAPPSAPQETAPATTAPSSEPPAETAETTTANASQKATPDAAQTEKPAGIHWGRAIAIGLLLIIPALYVYWAANFSLFGSSSNRGILIAIGLWLAGVLWAGKQEKRSWRWAIICLLPISVAGSVEAIIFDYSAYIPGVVGMINDLPPPLQEPVESVFDFVVFGFVGKLLYGIVYVPIAIIIALFPAVLLTLVWRDQPLSQHQPTPANNQ